MKSNTLTSLRNLVSNRPAQRALLLAGVLAISAVVTGCQVLAYRGPNGERFVRSSLGANTSVSSLTVETGTNGLRRIELQGYQNESTQALSSVTSAAVSAAIKSAK
jgi:hypothetical protein